MGKLFHADSVKKEGVKQDSWLQDVNKLLASYQGPLLHFVERLMQYDNIPRKQKAFENFVSNSLNLKRDPATVRQLWAIIEPCQARVSPEKNTEAVPWRGFFSEATEVLKRNGGCLDWKLLQANLAKRMKSTHPKEEYDEIKLLVLANVPQEYLSSQSKLVSLPRDS